MAKPKTRRATKGPAKKRISHGGSRAGAGRKRDKLPDEVVERLKVVPTDAVELDTWVRRFLAELLVLQMSGKVSVDLAASLRTTCGEIRRAMPKVAAPSDDDDDDDDDDLPGAELDEVDEKDDGNGPLRVE